MLAAKRPLPVLLGILFLALAATPPLLAQGRILIDWPDGRILPQDPTPPRPPPTPGQLYMHLRALKVGATITDGVAVTNVEQSFQNPVGRQIEGTFVFPLPDNVAVGDFAMTVDGKTLTGEVLDADAARRTYEEIVRRTRDPGLLEYLGSRLFRARVFPIPANGKVDIKLQYSQTLEEQAGLGAFRHPLKNDSAVTPTIDSVAITVQVRSKLPLTTVFSPSHECSVRRTEHEATLGYEASHVQPDRDFLLYYQRKDAPLGMVLLTHRAAGDTGTFLLRVSPRIEAEALETQPKDIAFVIDTSGSMAGRGKIEQARRALKFCINSLAPADRFNIYGFSTEVRPFRERLVGASGEVKDAALAYADDLKALGGTNINQALLTALGDDPQDDARVYLVVFMTDGQPTVDVTNPEEIRKNVQKRNSRNVRFHVFGVGSDVNTHLLDKLAEDTRGTRDYCAENEDLELKLSAFVMRLASPVLTNLKLRIEGVRAADVYPHELPDLFRGNDLVVLGRYEGDGTASIRLTGRTQDGAQSLAYSGEFPRRDLANDFLPRLWANRKVAYLLDQIRLHGQNKELVDEVTRLAKRYGIVTPYTSALILEDEPRDGVIRFGGRTPVGGRAAGGRGAGRFAAPATAPPARADGAEAVEYSRRLKIAKDASILPEAGSREGSGALALRHVGEKTFANQDGRWTDTAWDGRQKPITVTAFTPEYFKLLEQNPELKNYFALGARVLVVLNDAVYETIPEPSVQNEPDPN